MITVEKIRGQLKVQPIEDVYSLIFAKKEIDENLEHLFFESFDPFYLDSTDFIKKKLKHVINWVDIKVENENLKVFPSFLEVYLGEMYKPNGMKNYFSSYVPEIVLPRELEPFENPDLFVKEFEKSLLKRDWWTESDEKIWSVFKSKREKASFIEKYLDNFHQDLDKYDIDLEPQKCLEIVISHCDKIKLEIARMNLFEYELDRIPQLEKLRDYFVELSKIPQRDWNKFIDHENDKDQRKVEQTLKLNLLHQFGIIDFLKKLWEKNKISQPIEKLLAPLINEKESSIQPRLTDINDSKLRNPTSNSKLTKFMNDFNVEPDSIKIP